MDLLLAVAHRREDDARVGILLVGSGDRSDGVRTRVNDLGSAEALRCDVAGAVLHPTVSQRGAVLDDQHALAANLRRLIHEQRGSGLHDERVGIESGDILAHLADILVIRRVHFIDDDHVGSPDIGLAGVVSQLVPRTVRVRHCDPQIRLIEREVVVAAIPNDDIGFLLGLAQNRLVIHAGVDDDAPVNVRFVLLALLDGAVVLIQVGVSGKALHGLLHQIAVGHRMPDHHDLLAHLLQHVANVAGGLGFAGAGTDSANRDQRLAALDHRGLTSHQTKVRAQSIHQRRFVHHILVRHVRVGKHHLIDFMLTDQLREFLFGVNGNPGRVELSGQFRGIPASLNVRDLRSSESYDLVVGVTTEIGVEVVEITPGGSHDDDSNFLHTNFAPFKGICDSLKTLPHCQEALYSVTRPRRSFKDAFTGKNVRNQSNFTAAVIFRDLRGLN